MSAEGCLYAIASRPQPRLQATNVVVAQTLPVRRFDLPQ
jgi:hypothetical protein